MNRVSRLRKYGGYFDKARLIEKANATVHSRYNCLKLN